MSNLSFRLLPGCCVLCDRWSGRHLDLCRDCERDLPWIREACQYCGLPLTESHDLCAKCIIEKPDFSAVLCSFSYQFPVDIMIRRFKDNRHLASGKVLASLLATQYQSTLEKLAGEDTFIVPVPLHASRQRSRGFNQSALIAREIAAVSSIPIDEKSVIRVAKTSDQKGLSLTRRQNNLHGIFKVTRPMRGKRLLLVDDVVTTTATVSEITTALMASGADDVVVLALARTPARNNGAPNDYSMT